MQRYRGTLVARNIAKSYGDTVVLDRLSLTVTPSSRVGVVGPNGIGKSTLLRLLAGLEASGSGTPGAGGARRQRGGSTTTGRWAATRPGSR